jgi:hypothetical protein
MNIQAQAPIAFDANAKEEHKIDIEAMAPEEPEQLRAILLKAVGGRGDGLGPVVNVAQVATIQPSVAPANVTPDPERTESLAKCAEAVGYATGDRP